MRCEYCYQPMSQGKRFYGNYCPTATCFNSEYAREYKGPRIYRRV